MCTYIVTMKKGDLVKFTSHMKAGRGYGPCGVIITDPKRRPSSKFSGRRGLSVYVVWSDKYTPCGDYQTSLLKVINESR